MECKLVFGAIIVPVYKDSDGSIWVLIKERIDPGPEGIDHGKLEAVAETYDPNLDQNIISTAVRGCREELCLPNLGFSFASESIYYAFGLMGGYGNIARSITYDCRKNQLAQILNPYSLFQGVRKNRSGRTLCLNAANFVGVFYDKIRPKTDEESCNPRWVYLNEMLELLKNPQDFSFTYSAICQICHNLKSGSLKL